VRRRFLVPLVVGLLVDLANPNSPMFSFSDMVQCCVGERDVNLLFVCRGAVGVRIHSGEAIAMAWVLLVCLSLHQHQRSKNILLGFSRKTYLCTYHHVITISNLAWE
jgi:hypothetical protein